RGGYGDLELEAGPLGQRLGERLRAGQHPLRIRRGDKGHSDRIVSRPERRGASRLRAGHTEGGEQNEERSEKACHSPTMISACRSPWSGRTSTAGRATFRLTRTLASKSASAVGDWCATPCTRPRSTAWWCLRARRTRGGAHPPAT